MQQSRLEERFELNLNVGVAEGTPCTRADPPFSVAALYLLHEPFSFYTSAPSGIYAPHAGVRRVVKQGGGCERWHRWLVTSPRTALRRPRLCVCVSPTPRRERMHAMIVDH